MIPTSLTILLLLALAALCGFTTLRIPPKPKEDRRRLACVGDSITYGCTIPLFFLRRYPARLGRRLGQHFQVGVFAVNDRTLQDCGNKPFRKERAFRQSLAFRPETLVVLLGTNDSKDKNWRSDEHFKEELRALLAAYRALSAPPRILLCTPPCGYRPLAPLFGLSNDAKLERIPHIAALIRALAAEESIETVDLFTLTEGRRELFSPDGLHPNSRGAQTIAEEILLVLKEEGKNNDRSV